jgi:CRP/FNR family transcriptional regulator, cyclic AMP receptor protein
MASHALIHAMRSKICKTLSAQQAEHIASATIAREFPPGSLIMQEGDRESGLVFLLRGTAEIFKDVPGSVGQVVATVDGPTMLGEISLVTGQPHRASVRAQTNCDCYVLTRTQYLRLLEVESLAVYKLVAAIADMLAQRVIAMNDKVIALSQ